MKIYRAVKTNLLSQGFGVKNTNPSVLHIYQEAGELGHDGLDWGVVCKNNSIQIGGQCEQVFCDIDGHATITYIQKDVKAGFGIMAQDQDGIHKHCWWHFDSINSNLKVGDRIEGGDLLGVAGNTGVSTGAHLHRGVYSYLEDYNNGYHGAVNPTDFYVPIFVNDLIANLQNQVGILRKMLALLKLKLGIK